MRLFNPTGKLLSCSQRPGNHKRAPEKDALLLKSLHSSRSLQSKRYEFFWKIGAEIFSLFQLLKLNEDTSL